MTARLCVAPGARQRVAEREVLFGAFLNTGSPVTAEIMAAGGFDWLVVDLEHGAGDEVVALSQLQAVAAAGTIALVRVESPTAPRIGRALDMGAAGVLVPQIRSVAEAELAVSCCRYSGRRGVAKGNRAWQWGPASHEDLARADASVICAIQIETEPALRAVADIAALDGVDALFIGPSDLGRALGIEGADHPDFLEAATSVAVAAANAGKAAGILVDTVDQAEVYVDLGFTFVGCSSDGGLLMRAGQSIAAALCSLRG
jgi:4-hydroxy-2-oxoheptanedioate aldolase